MNLLHPFKMLLHGLLVLVTVGLVGCGKDGLVAPCDHGDPALEQRSAIFVKDGRTEVAPVGPSSLTAGKSGLRSPEDPGGGDDGISDDGDDEADNERSRKKVSQ